jgi:hypothetical protein
MSDKLATRVAKRFQAQTSDDLWLTREDVAKVCFSCAEKMASLGIRKVRASVLFSDERVMTAAWESLPKGWTEDSLKDFWNSLTGDNKHKVTKCIKEMEGKVDDPGAFCASLADKVKPGWREKSAADETVADEDFLVQAAQAFNRKYAKTRFIMGTPEVRDHGSMLHLRVALQPYNDSGVDSLNVWVTGDDAKVSVAGQHVGEGANPETEGFGHVMAEDKIKIKGMAPDKLAEVAFRLSKKMK